MWQPNDPFSSPAQWWKATLIAGLLVPLVMAQTTWRERIHRRIDARERGDVPGWVMVTLMTAGLVAIVWVLADDWLRQLFQQAVDRVSGP